MSAREFEIQILERDAKIDAETALCLRKNLIAHFFPRDAAPREPLTELPHQIEFDEAAALKVARQQCPLDGSLPLEKELQLRENHLREIRRRDLIEPPRPAGTLEKISDYIDIGVGHPTMAQKIAKLKEKIAERDRSDRTLSARIEPSATRKAVTSL